MQNNSRTLETELIKRLKKVFNDKEFVMGMLVFVYDDKDRQLLIDYIDKGEDVTVESVSAIALNLCDLRDEINFKQNSITLEKG